jgi:hypothetical protein
MDSPISSNSFSSVNTSTSPTVFSPVPRRTPILHKKSNFDEIPFLDLMEDLDSRSSRTNSYLMEKIQKMAVEDNDFDGCERRISLKFTPEAERRTIIESTDPSDNILENMRPPSRAINPQCNDEQFVKMNQELHSLDGKNTFGKKARLIDWI